MHINIMNQKELPFKIKYVKNNCQILALQVCLFPAKRKGFRFSPHLFYLAMNCVYTTETC